MRVERQAIAGVPEDQYADASLTLSSWVLLVNKWADLGAELLSLTRKGAWGEMTKKIPDELLDALVPSGPYTAIADILKARFEGLAGRLTLPLPEDPAFEPDVAEVIRALRN